MNYKKGFLIGILLVLLFIIVVLASAAVFQDLVQGDFSGIYNNTYYNTTNNAVQLSPGNLTGNYTSRIFDGAYASWNNISWAQGYHQQELPSNQAVEAGLEGMNMTGNAVLLHLNNDSSFGENDARFYDFSGSGNNASLVNGSVYNSSGKFNGGYQFDGINDYTLNPFTPPANFTYSIWFYKNTNSGGLMCSVGVVPPGTSYNNCLFINSSGSLRYYYYTTTSIFLGSSVIPANQWNHAAVTVTSSGASLYLNGVLQQTNAAASASYRFGNISLGFAAYYSGVYNALYFNGTIDEVAIWNRSLSASEILNIYKRGVANLNISVRSCDDASCSDETWNATYTNQTYNNMTASGVPNNRYFQYLAQFSNINETFSPFLYNVSIGYTVLDITAPNVSLNLPSNGFNISSSTYTFNFTGADETATTLNCTLTIDSVTKAENATTSNGTLTNLQASGITEGSHLWNVSCKDTAGNSNTSSTRSFYADLTKPLITLNAPGSGINSSTNNVTFNFTMTEEYSYPVNCSLYIDNAIITSNSTTINNTLTNLNATNIAQGNHTWNITCLDNAGNSNSSSRIFIVDITAPNATLTFSNNTYNSTSSQNFTANLTDNLGIKNATLNIRNSSGDIINQTTASFNTNSTVIGIVYTFLNNGIFRWFYTIYDWAFNLFTTEERTFTYDSVSPSITLNSPENEFNTTSQNITFNFTLSDGLSPTFNCSLYIDNVFKMNNASALNGTLTNLNASSISEGSHNWTINCSDLSGNFNASSRTFFIDLTPPNITNIVYSPNSSEFLDPYANITFNATIQDNRMPISSVILQYYNGTSWNNATMTNNSATNYNATISLIPAQANYTFNIRANDTLNNINVSSNQTFSSLWDCTWTATSDLGQVTGWNQNKNIGNITINNTGDAAYSSSNCSLDFRISYDLPEGRIYYDGEYVKNVGSYTIAAKSNRTIIINATYASEVKQESAVITLDEFRQRSSARYSNTTATLVTNQNGPYLYQKITSSPSSVYLTPGNITLQAYVRNLMGSSTINESNTAYNVSFYWTLPSGLTNVSGNLTSNFTNITDNSLYYNNIEASFTSLASMTPGVKSIYLYAYGYNLTSSQIIHANNITLLTEQLNISFLCYNISDSVCVTSCGYLQDSDCSAPATTTSASASTSSGGGGGGSSSTKYERSEATFELVRGREQSFILEIKNKYSNIVRNISISVSGINSKYIEIAPGIISQIAPKSSQDITIRINAPSYFNENEYKLIFRIKGTIIDNSSNLNYEESKLITLKIIEISREETWGILNESELILKKMNNSGMNTKEILSLLNEIYASYNATNFLEVKNIYEKIKELHDSAVQASSIINELNQKISDAEKQGISILETKKLLYIAETAFKRGDFSLALERLKEAKLTYALEVKGEFNFIYSVKNHPVEYAGALIGLGIFSIGSSFLIRLRLYRKKLKMLHEEEILLLELMKVVQRECFNKKSMSIGEYEAAMDQYENRLSEVVEDKIKTETKVMNLFKIKGKKKALFEERKKLIELIKRIQDEYLNKNIIETRIYENMLKSYTTRLTEVEEQVTFLDANEAMKSFKI